MSEMEKKLEQEVAFAAQTEQWLRGPIGQYLLDRSKEEIDAALQELKTVAPNNVDEIRRLQNVIARNEGVELWLGEIIQAGLDARSLLAGEEP